MFEFELARKLGKGVDEMRRGMSRREFLYWVAYKNYRFRLWQEKTSGGEKGELWDEW